MYARNLFLRVFTAPLSRGRLRSYARDHAPCKIHFGCGPNVLPGWLNTDTNLPKGGIEFVDVRKPLPFEDNSVDYVYHEHLFEHLDRATGERFLRECRRVLKPGGKLRIATPNIDFLVGLFSDPRSDLQDAYLQWFQAVNRIGQTARPQVYVMNTYFYSWGHRFIYDKVSLGELLAQVGFTAMTWEVPGKSSDPNLLNLEHHGDSSPKGFNELETMVVEARKPLA